MTAKNVTTRSPLSVTLQAGPSLALYFALAAACGGSPAAPADEDPPPPLPPIEDEGGEDDDPPHGTPPDEANDDANEATGTPPAAESAQRVPPEEAVTYRMREDQMRSLLEAAIDGGAPTDPVVPEEVQAELPDAPSCDDPVVHQCAARGMGLERAGRIEEAIDRYAAACREGLAIACGNLAHFLAIGEGIQPDPLGAIPLFRYACRAGQLTNCARYGVRRARECEQKPLAAICSSGDWTPEDVEDLVTEACDDGVAIACSTRGAIAEERGRWDRAAAYYERGCDGDDGYGCHNLADMHMGKGSAAAVDSERAAELHGRACERDRFASSCMKRASLRARAGEPLTGAAEDLGRACEYGELQICQLLRDVNAGDGD